MKIARYCGLERLPGGSRLWHRLAMAAGFNGTLEVQGYGTVGKPGREQLHAYINSVRSGFVVGDYSTNIIRVWLRCACSTVDESEEIAPSPLDVFVHELGHYVQDRLGTRDTRPTHVEEGIATRYGRRLLERVK